MERGPEAVSAEAAVDVLRGLFPQGPSRILAVAVPETLDDPRLVPCEDLMTAPQEAWPAMLWRAPSTAVDRPALERVHQLLAADGRLALVVALGGADSNEVFAWAAGDDQESPKETKQRVMIGVTLRSISDALAAQLGVTRLVARG